mgnify:FL=1
MELDTFYEVIVPAHMDKRLKVGRPGYYEYTGGGFFSGYRYVPAVHGTWEPIMVSEKRYIFEQRKKAKKFCLENDYPFEYIHERKC